MNLIDQVQTLLRADMINECYYLVIEKFVRYFAKLNNINVTEEELNNKEIVDKIFYFLCWKIIENYSSNKEYIYKLMDLRYYLVFEKDKSKLFILYKDVIDIYIYLTTNEIKKYKINIADELKYLNKNEDYELAVDVLEQIYYANKFREILKKYNIKYSWYSNCEELSYNIQYNIENLKPYVVDIGYNVDENLKYKLERLIDNIKNIEEIL